MSAQYYIAKTTQSGEFVLLAGAKVIAGPFVKITDAIKAREKLEREVAAKPA